MSHGGCYQIELPLGRRYDDDDNEEEEAGGCGEGEGKGGREVEGEEEEKGRKIPRNKRTARDATTKSKIIRDVSRGMYEKQNNNNRTGS